MYPVYQSYVCKLSAVNFEGKSSNNIEKITVTVLVWDISVLFNKNWHSNILSPFRKKINLQLGLSNNEKKGRECFAVTWIDPIWSNRDGEFNM